MLKQQEDKYPVFDVMAYKTLSSTKVPVPMREPFILTGYRLLNQPWTYYVKSLFRWHNETINVWSHLLAAIIITGQTLYYGKTYDLLDNPEGNKILIFSMGCVFMLLVSSFAHLMAGRSTKSHYIFFLFDYSGITLYTYSTGLGSLYICGSEEVYDKLETIYIPVTVAMAITTFTVTAFVKIKVTDQFSRKRKVFMIFPFVVFAIWMTVPQFQRYWSCYWDSECLMSSLNHITIVYILLILTGIAYSAHIPEKWLPGHFDNFGQSHHVFHLCASVTNFMQLIAIDIDINTGVARHANFDLRKGLLGFLAVCISNCFVIVILVPVINKTIDNVKNK